MAEFVHQLNLLEHIIPIGPVLVQFQDHNFVTRFMCDLEDIAEESGSDLDHMEIINPIQS